MLVQLPGQLVVWVRLLQVVQGQSLMQQVACLEPLWVLLVERGPQGQADALLAEAAAPLALLGQ